MRNNQTRLLHSRPVYTALVWLVLLAGVFIRIAHFPELPPGFNQDEASAAYEAWSLLHTGADRWGNPYPSYFPSWGSGQNVLLSYLSIPSVAALGLNVFAARLPALVLGILTLPLLYLTLRPWGRFAALLGLTVLALVPWHFMLSRWALESNLLPFFMLLGGYCTGRALTIQRRRWIIPSLLPFALALYAYGTTVVILPPMFLLMLLLFRRRLREQAGAWLLALLLFLLLVFPFALSLYTNYIAGHDLAWTKALPFSAPHYPVTRLAMVSGTARLALIGQNLSFLANGCSDGLPFNLMTPYHLLFPLAVSLGFAGFLVLLVQTVRSRSSFSPALVLALIFGCWFAASLGLLFSFDLNVNRFNHFYLPCIVMGTWFLRQAIGRVVQEGWRWRVQLAVLLLIALNRLPVILHYFNGYEREEIRSSFNKGLEEALRNASGMPVAQLYIAPDMELPYMYTLFFLSYPPGRFRREVQYEINGGSYVVKRFGRYIFSREQIDRSRPYGYVARRDRSNLPGRSIMFQNELWEVGIVK